MFGRGLMYVPFSTPKCERTGSESNMVWPRHAIENTHEARDRGHGRAGHEGRGRGKVGRRRIRKGSTANAPVGRVMRSTARGPSGGTPILQPRISLEGITGPRHGKLGCGPGGGHAHGRFRRGGHQDRAAGRRLVPRFHERRRDADERRQLSLAALLPEQEERGPRPGRRRGARGPAHLGARSRRAGEQLHTGARPPSARHVRGARGGQPATASTFDHRVRRYGCRRGQARVRHQRVVGALRSHGPGSRRRCPAQRLHAWHGRPSDGDGPACGHHDRRCSGASAPVVADG